MKKVILFAALCLFSLSIFAQSAKQKLGFIPYADASSDQYNYRKMAYDYLYEAATRIFINTQRFEVLDRSKFNTLNIEKNMTKGDDFINAEIVAQGKVLAAEVLAVAKLTALSLSQSEENKAWTVFFTVELKQIDVETSKALNAMQLKGELNDKIIIIGNKTIENPKTAKSPEEAISIVVSKMEKDLEEWIHEYFPVRMNIVYKNDEERILYANGGKNIGLTLRNNMCVRRDFRLPTGDRVVETIAELKFTKADGVGETSTRFEPKNKKEWEKIVKAIKDYPGEIFVMECVSGRTIFNSILGK